MDTWAFHFTKSKLYYLAINWTWFKRWAGPDSWKNKNRSKNPVVRYLMRTVFSFTTDLWHHSQFWMLTAFMVLIAWNMENYLARVGELQNFPHWANVILWVGIQKFLFGGAFEIAFTWLSNAKEKQGTKEAPNSLNLDRGKYTCEKCQKGLTAKEYVIGDGLCEDCWPTHFMSGGK